MSINHNLAPELLNKILLYLRPSDQRVCQFVCKSWNLAAKQIYFSSIRIKDRTSLLKLISSLQNNGCFVQSLRIDKCNKLTFPELCNLLARCSQLLTLYAHYSYFEWLSLSDFKLKNLKILTSKGESWQLHIPKDNHFYRAAYRFCKTLEKIEIPEISDLEPLQRFGGAIKYLSNFENLKSLRFPNRSYAASIYLDTLLSTCEKLKSLNISVGHSLYSPEVLNRHITHYSTMRQLEIFLTRFSVEHLQYMIDRFINVSKLSVYIDGETALEDWKRDEQSIRSFTKHTYLPFIKPLAESSLNIRIEDSSTLSNLYADIFSSFDELKTVRYNFQTGQSERTHIQLNTKQGSVHLDMNFKFLDDEVYDLYLPYIGHLVEYGHLIKSLDIDITNQINFNTIINNCPNLNTLIVRANLIEPPFDSTQRTVPQTTPETMVYVHNPNNHVVLKSLLNISICGGMIPLEFFDFLSSSVPNLRTLSINYCSLEDSLVKTPLICLSKLKFLKEFQLDSSLNGNGPSNINTCVIINIGDDQHPRFYFASEKGIEKLLSRDKIPEHVFPITFNFCSSLVKVKLNTGGLNDVYVKL